VEGPIVLPLTRKVVEYGNAKDASTKSFFVGTLQIGGGGGREPQDLDVSFETASGLIILDSTRCQTPACLKHHRYKPSTADGAVDVMVDGTPARSEMESDKATLTLDTHDLEQGTVTGGFVRDHVCLGSKAGGRACANVALLAASDMDSEPFASLPFDGIVGFGLDGLSLNGAFNFLERLARTSPKMAPQFALFVPPVWAQSSGSAEIVIGGHNEARLASPLKWLPVEQPEDGYWQVKIQAVHIGGKPISLCEKGCRGIIDSGTSRIAVPAEALTELQSKLAVTTPQASYLGAGDCSAAEGKDLELILDDSTKLTLSAKDYAGREGGRCVPMLHPWTSDSREIAGRSVVFGQTVHTGGVGFGTIVLGEPVLRKYYTAYDWQEKRVGFGLAAAPAAPTSASSPVEEQNVHEGQEEFILLQCPAGGCRQ